MVNRLLYGNMSYHILSQRNLRLACRQCEIRKMSKLKDHLEIGARLAK